MGYKSMPTRTQLKQKYFQVKASNFLSLAPPHISPKEKKSQSFTQKTHMSSQKYIATNFLHIPSKGLCSSYPLKT
jgi:hypothetical protein